MGFPSSLILGHDYVPETVSILHTKLRACLRLAGAPCTYLVCGAIPWGGFPLLCVSPWHGDCKYPPGLGPQPNGQTSEQQSGGIAASYQVALIGFSEFLSLGTIIPVCRLFRFSRELETQVFALKSLEFKCWQPVEVLVDHFEGQHANLTTFVGRAGPGGLRVTCF